MVGARIIVEVEGVVGGFISLVLFPPTVKLYLRN
jgi:hypothetical protein